MTQTQAPSTGTSGSAWAEPKPTAEAAAEFILQGGDTVRVSVQLIRAANDEQCDK